MRYLRLCFIFTGICLFSFGCSQDNQKLAREDNTLQSSSAKKPQRSSADNRAVISKPDARMSFIDYCLNDKRPFELDKTVTILLSLVDEKLCGIAQAKIGRLDAINLIGANISDVRPFRFFSSVESVDLRFNFIEDMTPLGTMIGLKTMVLDSNPLKSFGDLSGLQKLVSLSLKQTPIKDLTALSALVSLQELYLDRSAVLSLSGAEKLLKLERLHLDSTNISDLRPISQLVALKSLRLSGAKVDDLSPLQGLVNLEELDLSNTPLALDPSLITPENCPIGPDVAELLSNFCSASVPQP